jgi:mannose/cellobiose epimerase-like protein (N-acyl-D-glucosamine 2-epimerase family)
MTGTVRSLDLVLGAFEIQCRSGDRTLVFVSSQTNFEVVRNLDGANLDRYPNPNGYQDDNGAKKVEKYIHENRLVVVQGILQEHEGKTRFEARLVHLVQAESGLYLSEQTHWWLTQTSRLADQWLDSLFDDRRTYQLDDFVQLYRTNLSISGLPTDDNIQECAVLSRLIYGLSAAYLLTGQDRYRLAARAGVQFQRDAFRSISHDGRHCFWAFGRRRRRYGTELIVPSQFADDLNSIPLYEQIYALAGLTQYYRISLDWEVLEDIRRTICAFNAYYLDEQSGNGGYFSHIDYATMRPDRNQVMENNNKKNWNSVGDHIPAYLVNLLLALDPLPAGSRRKDVDELQIMCREMLDRTTILILEKFPDRNSKIPYVNERFREDWTPDHTYRWQQNRAVIGHNFKIAWNLTRVASYYDCLALRGEKGLTRETDPRAMSKRCIDMANRLCQNMTELGIDQIRGGCFDAVEREPKNGMPVEFSWLNTKDFWQQEQAILAYLILYGYTSDPNYLTMARETTAFWNVFFLDRENRGIYFRVTENGLPVVTAGYGGRGGHSDASGYHVFELNYLAHIYTRSYVSGASGTDSTFSMFFKPDLESQMQSINVLPDFIPPGRVEIVRIIINGVPRKNFAKDNFQVELNQSELGSSIVVEFRAVPR